MWLIDQAARLQEAIDWLSQPRQQESRSPPPTLAWAREFARQIDEAIAQAKQRKKEDTRRRRAKPERPPTTPWVLSMAGQIAIVIKDVEKRRDGDQEMLAVAEPERPEASWLVEVSTKVEVQVASYAKRFEIKEAKPATAKKASPKWLVEMVDEMQYTIETFLAPPVPADPAGLEIDVSAPAWIADAGRQLGQAVKQFDRRSQRRPAASISIASLPYWIADSASQLTELVRNLQRSARPAVIDDPSRIWKTGTWHDLPGWGRDAYQRLGTAICRLERRLDFKRSEPKQPAIPGWILQTGNALDRALGLVEEKLELEGLELGEPDTWAERVLLGLQSDKSLEDLLNGAPNLVALRRRLKDPRPTRYHPDRTQLKAGETFVYGLLQPKKIDERDANGRRQVYFVDQGVGRSRVNQHEPRAVEWRVFDPTVGQPIVRASEITIGMDAFKAQQEEYLFRLDSSSKLGAEPLIVHGETDEREPRDVPWLDPSTGRTRLITFREYLEREEKCGTSAELHAKMQIA